jgi:hypothetical protein
MKPMGYDHREDRRYQKVTIAMKRKLVTANRVANFEAVKKVALTLPGVEATTRYDGSPVLKADGLYMAGLATHPSAEPATLVVKMAMEDRDGFLEDAPETYYLTEYYRPHPVVLVRLSHIDQGALRDLLSIAWRLVVTRAGGRKRRQDPDRPRPLRTG